MPPLDRNDPCEAVRPLGTPHENTPWRNWRPHTPSEASLASTLPTQPVPCAPGGGPAASGVVPWSDITKRPLGGPAASAVPGPSGALSASAWNVGAPPGSSHDEQGYLESWQRLVHVEAENQTLQQDYQAMDNTNEALAEQLRRVTLEKRALEAAKGAGKGYGKDLGKAPWREHWETDSWHADPWYGTDWHSWHADQSAHTWPAVNDVWNGWQWARRHEPWSP